MTVIASSENRTWPWSHLSTTEAEIASQSAYPSIYAHLSRFKGKLCERQDKGRFWWELRSCGYYDVFEAPKIVHTKMTWWPQFAYVAEPMYLLNTAYVLPTSDPYLLAVLNSPAIWTYMWRLATRGKDDALELVHSFVATLPIPSVEPESKAMVEAAVHRLISITRNRQNVTTQLLDWLAIEFEIVRASQKLHALYLLGPEDWIAEVKKLRGRSGLSASGLKRLRDEYDHSIGPLITETEEAYVLEREISDFVNEAYGLTPEDVELMWKTAPPRMPIKPN